MKYYKINILLKGRKQEIILKGNNKNEILDIIHNNSLYKKGIISKIVEMDIPLEDKIKDFLNTLKMSVFKKKVNYSVLIAAFRQLSALTLAQISLKDSLDNIAENTSDELVKELFTKASEAIDNGIVLSNIFKEYEPYLGNLATAMIELGEQTGSLGEALASLADIYEDVETNRQKFKKAMRYPLITLGAMAGAFTILIVFVVPKFKDIFEKLHTQLPLPTRILLGLEYIFEHYGLLILITIFLMFVTHKYLYKTKIEYKYSADKLLLKLKILGPVVRYSSISRFLLVLTELTKAGVPLIEALNISNGILDNEVLKRQINTIMREINQGQTFSQALKEHDLLDNITLQMIAAGEEAGNLDQMLKNASSYYKKEFDQIIDNIGDAIEPIMMAVIGGLVLLLALGIFMPMWNLTSAAKVH